MGRGKESKEERKEGRDEGEMIGKTGSFWRPNQGQLVYHYQ